MLMLAAATVTGLGAGAAEAADVFLRPPADCSNDGDGTTYQCASQAGASGAHNSWDSVRSSLQPGDVLRVDGTWVLAALVSIRASGTQSAPIRITSYDPQQPARITADMSAGLLYLQADHLEVDHLVFANSTGLCLYLGQEGPNDIHRAQRIHDNHFEDCGNGISISYIDDVDIYDNRLENISGPDSGNQDHCIYPAQGASRIRAYRNLCMAEANIVSSHCLHVYHDEPPGPADDVEFHDNVCVDFTVGAGVYSGSTNVRVYSNTFVGARGSYGGLRCNYGGSQAAFHNNIVMGEPSYMAAVQTTDCTVTLDHNLYFQTAGTMGFELQGQTLDLAAWQGSHDANSIVADPLLTDAAAADVHLTESSPARDSGDDQYAADQDYYGAPRVVGASIDIGAAEYSEQGGAGGSGGSASGGAAGFAGAGGGATGGAPTGVANEDPDDEGGCGCRAAGSTTPGLGPLAGLLFALALLLRRRLPAPQPASRET